MSESLETLRLITRTSLGLRLKIANALDTEPELVVRRESSEQFIENHLPDAILDIRSKSFAAARRGESSVLALFGTTKYEDTNRTEGLRNAVADHFMRMGLVAQRSYMDNSGAIAHPNGGEVMYTGPTMWVFGVEISWLPDEQLLPPPQPGS